MEQIKKAADSETLPTANSNESNDIIAQMCENVKPHAKYSEMQAAVGAVADAEVLSEVGEFVCERKKRKCTMTVSAVKRFCNRLQKLGISREIQLAMIDKAITSGWMNVYPLSESEMKLISPAEERRTSYDIDKIKSQFNKFDDLGW